MRRSTILRRRRRLARALASRFVIERSSPAVGRPSFVEGRAEYGAEDVANYVPHRPKLRDAVDDESDAPKSRLELPNPLFGPFGSGPHPDLAHDASSGDSDSDLTHARPP